MDLEYPTGDEGRRRLERIADDIKRAGRGKPYDVVVGVSGGCDSSYMVWLAKDLGLRPLAAHFDNTWNSNTAVSNLHRVLSSLDVDLYTYVVDNEEYDDIFASFLRAGVPDLEAPTDLGLATVLYLAAEKYGVKYIFEGHSFRTEGIAPLGWIYMDARYVRSVHARYGRVPLKTYPDLWMRRQLKWMVVDGIKKTRPLYYIDYRKRDAMEFLTTLGWQWYGGHHMESLSAAFLHAYYLVRRYGVNPGMLGYAALVRSGQMTREEGLRALEALPGFDPARLDMVKRRLGFTDAEFEQLMQLPYRTYRDFSTYKRSFELMRPFYWALYKLDRMPKSFYLKFTRPDPPWPVRHGELAEKRDGARAAAVSPGLSRPEADVARRP